MSWLDELAQSFNDHLGTDLKPGPLPEWLKKVVSGEPCPRCGEPLNQVGPVTEVNGRTVHSDCVEAS